MDDHVIPHGEMGILLIHGFGGDISEIAPLAERLCRMGFAVSCARLHGHGGTRSDLRHTSWRLWLSSAQEAFNALKERTKAVFIIGFSMGGLIAINLAIDNPVFGIATLNSPIYCWNKRQILSNAIQDLHRGERAHLRHYLQSGIKFPWQTLLNFQRLLDTTKGRLPYMDTPIFVAQGLQDDTVSPRSAPFIMENVNAATRRLGSYPSSGHLICHGPDFETLLRDLCAFFEEIGFSEDRV